MHFDDGANPWGSSGDINVIVFDFFSGRLSMSNIIGPIKGLIISTALIVIFLKFT